MIGFAMCGSFCTHKTALTQLESLLSDGHEIQPIVSENVYTTDTRFGKSDDLIARLEKLSAEGFFEKNKIDEIWIFGGTNDSWADSPLGEIMYGEISREEKFKVLPGFSALLALVKSLPIERPLILINSELKPEIENGYKEMAAHYGIPALQLKDVDKKDGHPTAAGMKAIAEQFLAFRREV